MLFVLFVVQSRSWAGIIWKIIWNCEGVGLESPNYLLKASNFIDLHYLKGGLGPVAE